jgi:hypothetical protein
MEYGDQAEVQVAPGVKTQIGWNEDLRAVCGDGNGRFANPRLAIPPTTWPG